MPLDSFAPAGFPIFFTIAAVLVAAIFVLVIVGLVRSGAREARTAADNRAQPEQSVAARVTGKRTQVEGGGETRVRNLYFVTFELPDGQRRELKLPEADYAQVAEGDEGTLTHQGTWYRRFERRRVIPTGGAWEAPGGPSLTPPSG